MFETETRDAKKTVCINLFFKLPTFGTLSSPLSIPIKYSNYRPHNTSSEKRDARYNVTCTCTDTQNCLLSKLRFAKNSPIKL